MTRTPQELRIPEVCLILLIGPSGAGKSTFAAAHFRSTEVVSSDVCRGLVSDDENDQTVTADAFDLLHMIVAKRLAHMRLTVVDATNVQRQARRSLVRLARDHHALPIAIVFDMPLSTCVARNADRPERAGLHPGVIRRQQSNLKRSLRSLKREGFNRVFIFRSPAEVEATRIRRERMWVDRRDEHGPFDVVGDVHACFDELLALLEKMGYEVQADESALDGLGGYAVLHPEGRKLVLLGDLVDRGPKPAECLRLAMSGQESGIAIVLPGNHDVKLQRALRGRKVQRTHGLAETMTILECEPESFRETAASFLRGLVSHYVLDDGKLVVAHAGMKEELAGRASRRVRDFALYGETTGGQDEFGLPVRLNWALDYRGRAAVVYGHTPVARPGWLNNCINVDTGCCFGGALTALRYPERELVSVPAQRTYADPVRPLEGDAASLSAQQEHDDMLDLDDLGFGGSGDVRCLVETRLMPHITIRQQNSAAALEVMSRFAVDPRWLIYLPPTMAPSATSQRGEYLERPDEVFDYFHKQGAGRIVCQEKHMGSRAVVIACRDEEVTRQRFGWREDDDVGLGIVYTRTGRRFFSDAKLEQALLTRLRDAATAIGLWDELETGWICLDAELMPWSAKAQALLREQYAAVGCAGQAALEEAVSALRKACGNGADASALLQRQEERLESIRRFREAYRRYCWPVESLDDLRLAPFHLMASEEIVHVDRAHRWHMETRMRLGEVDPLLVSTAWSMIDLDQASSVREGVAWWEALTARGGEGMVVKPLDFVAHGQRGLVQPALKCRGREYLRIVYGPEYTSPANLDRLRQRGLRRKRSLALREFALGVEGLERFVRGEPLRRVHECVFGVLALESEPVDPRL